MDVFVSSEIKTKNSNITDSMKYLLVLIPTQNEKETKVPYAWRPKYLNFNCKMFQDDFDKKDFLKSLDFFECRLSEKKSTNKVLKNNAGYEQTAVVISVPSGKSICNKLCEETGNDGFKNEQKFITEVYEALFSTIFQDEYFEERYIFALESYCGDKEVENYHYPIEDKDLYNNKITKFIARDYGSKDKSNNMKRIEKLEVQFTWNVPLGNKLVKDDVKYLLEELDVVIPTGNNKKSRDFSLITGFTSFSDNDNNE